MNFKDWYTDSMDIFRSVAYKAGGITKHRREQVAAGIPCRVYQAAKPSVSMQDTAARIAGADKLMCAPDVALQSGDELQISIGGDGEPTRYFAGKPKRYTEPFGAVLPGLAHQELTITTEEHL